jgi:hypothetical protein
MKTLLEFKSSAVNSGEKQMAPGIPPMFSRYVEFLFTPIPHCTKNPIYVFPEMKLRDLVPSAYIHVSVRFIYSQDHSAYFTAAK